MSLSLPCIKIKEDIMSKDTLRQVANVLSVIIAITVNILASALPLNGQNTGEISDRFQVFFVPAGYVFAIWGIIYIGWIAFAIYQALPRTKGKPAPAQPGIALCPQRCVQCRLAVHLALQPLWLERDRHADAARPADRQST